MLKTAKDRPTPAREFSIRPDDRVVNAQRGWMVKQGAAWFRVREFFLTAPVITQGDCLRGVGVVERDGDIARIHA